MASITALDAAVKSLRDAVELSTYWRSDELVELVRLHRDAGLPLPDGTIALVRRTAVSQTWDGEKVKALAKTLTGPILNPGEAWADAALAELGKAGEAWSALLAHAATAISAKPSAKWEKQGRSLLDDVGPAVARTRIVALLPLVGRPRTVPLPRAEPEVNQLLDPYNANVLRGLIWLLAFTPADADSARALGALVQACLRKVPGIGPRNPKIANAAVYALSRVASDEALAQIARLASTVTFKGTLKEVNKALDAKAEELGLSRAEVEELAVPTYGLTEVGRRVDVLGDATAEIAVFGSSVELTWRNAAGKTVKSVPAAVRRDHAEELAEVKAAVKDINTMLTAQLERIDRQFLLQRTWRAEDWRARYLDHPLVGALARRLIWLVDDVPVGYADGELRDAADRVVPLAPEATVTLWHPAGRDLAEVLAWRGWLEAHRITQPFKQAHREVYLLTAAEENTRVYSNRFAAHVLRQHQFHALAAIRGWRNKLRLMVDDTYPPATRELPEWGLRAEFWVEGIGDDYGTDTTEAGSYLRIATDQIRFYPLTAPEHHAHAGGGGYEQWVGQNQEPSEPIPLADIPPLVLSEIMRDVDLFVGVGSVGNDPTWQDGGPQGRFREYWASYSFGELTATAQTRRDTLERLLPRLAVGKRATLEGRFLHVRGDLRTYKIHLGSGNILMTPNDQYLCIVPAQGGAAIGQKDVFLPFEGDRVLAVILSKAMLLADDTAITDPTITSQIRH